MRKLYLVTYDIGDPRRLARVYKLMRGYGDHLQLSVFLCDLSRAERAELKERLDKLLHDREDQVLLVDLGPSDGRGARVIEALGQRYEPPERVAIIV